ncbi:CDP-diacylglycerol--glycerol-3-phosphate 3-phosphatidyltransferase [Candidatus Synechococcus calcipolaris G9]|uniref:CDP-diacylglycerol--glycerol-3-phosphate 3-phosphatidyltransferase n=1 Tax=Candidatus Synechococcus calcipolaris G9 TaxID=1497997 RepID=A0ABT6F1V9_9SYNE|nr:CDP-diacylglycerol--glycerol-3-phosphate 3-phosphatidyltransferase [Candidatus Synechococcus calcipolaris]MDG2991842.1 CDP-diacylglycerol--glycerol-3-phosphate 3-phosphatidyltransferase [Candidatus Synechococcus calcipolaris G9]
MNLPNLITIGRLLLAPLLILVLTLWQADTARWWALGIFLLAALTDWLDGYLARRLNQITDLGKILDPLVDKILILAALLVLVQLGDVPAWSVFIILLREMFIASWRVNQTQVQGANIWGKLKTVGQILAVALLLAPLAPVWDIPILMIYGGAIALTVISGLIYIKESYSIPPIIPDTINNT